MTLQETLEREIEEATIQVDLFNNDIRQDYWIGYRAAMARVLRFLNNQSSETCKGGCKRG